MLKSEVISRNQIPDGAIALPISLKALSKWDGETCSDAAPKNVIEFIILAHMAHGNDITYVTITESKSDKCIALSGVHSFDVAHVCVYSQLWNCIQTVMYDGISSNTADYVSMTDVIQKVYNKSGVGCIPLYDDSAYVVITDRLNFDEDMLYLVFRAGNALILFDADDVFKDCSAYDEMRITLGKIDIKCTESSFMTEKIVHSLIDGEGDIQKSYYYEQGVWYIAAHILKDICDESLSVLHDIVCTILKLDSSSSDDVSESKKKESEGQTDEE